LNRVFEVLARFDPENPLFLNRPLFFPFVHTVGRVVRILQNPWCKRLPGSKSHILGVGMSEFIKTHGANGYTAKNPTFQGLVCQNLSKPIVKPAIRLKIPHFRESGCQNSSKPLVQTATRLKIAHFRGWYVRIYQNTWCKRLYGSKSHISRVGMSEFIKTPGENGYPAQNPTF
jgi:hypothetical protein